MRQLTVHVPRVTAGTIAQIARRHEAFFPVIVETHTVDGEAWAAVMANLPNERVGAFLHDVEGETRDAQIVLTPRGSLPIQPPLHELRGRVRDVTRRSTYELVLDSLQSVGSWPGLLGYSLLSGAVAAYGVVFEATWLLVAAMLIAPMGAPAMVCVVGSAIGEASMVWRGTLRFWTALVVLVAVAALLGVVYRLDISTATMEQITNLSAWSVLLALAGGAAGAQALARSDRDSLVTGTASGFLVAVALSPPAAVLGLSVPLERWDYVAQMGFLLVLTYVGIIAGGWLSLVLLGVGPRELTGNRGARVMRYAMMAGALVALSGLVGWQLVQVPGFRKADLTRRSVTHVRSAVESVPGVALVEASTRFTRPELRRLSGEGLLVDVVVERTAAAEDSPTDAVDEAAVRAAIAAELHARITGITPFVRVTVLPPTRSTIR